MDADRILGDLNAEQRAAAEATRGPVCILAGAGTGKTTTITRRIAWQVASGAFPASELVAVTFTDKAAGELRARLAGLGVEGVRASTFHSTALALLHRFHRLQLDAGDTAILVVRWALRCRPDSAAQTAADSVRLRYSYLSVFKRSETVRLPFAVTLRCVGGPPANP